MQLHTDLMWAMEMAIEFYSDLFHKETPLQPMQAKDWVLSFVLSVDSDIADSVCIHWCMPRWIIIS